MIPGWKLRREARRLGQQLRAIPEAVTDPIRQRYHDRVVFPSLGYREGTRPLGPKVAIFLLYQPRGIAESTVYTCGFLASKGYSVLAVSNAPVSATDAARLSPEVWRIVERPNFGYDFGGYRDGIRLLWRWNLEPETLMILNDSVWFPLDPDTKFIEQAERHPADIAGAILRSRDEERFLESYFYRIRGDVAAASAFCAYWENLELTSNKYNVIRRGERGFSQSMATNGHSLGAIYPNEDLPLHLETQDDSALRRMLAYAAYVDDRDAAERDTLLASKPGKWRDRVLDHARHVLVKRQAYSSFPVTMVRDFGYPFLKKGKDPVNRAWRAAYALCLRDEVLPAPHASILAEGFSTAGRT